MAQCTCAEGHMLVGLCVCLSLYPTGQTAGGGEDTLTADGRPSTAEDQGGGGRES